MARPRFKATPEQRKWVEAMSGYGIPEAEIARMLGENGIDLKTLHRQFRRELDTGGTKANVNVAQSLYRTATSGKHPGASMFWLKCRAGWRETSILRHTGPQGGAVEIAPESEESIKEKIIQQLRNLVAGQKMMREVHEQADREGRPFWWKGIGQGGRNGETEI